MDNQPIQSQAQANLGMFERRTGRLAFLLGIVYWAAIFIVPALLQLIVHFVLASGSGSTSPNALTAAVNIISLLFGIVGIILLIPVIISLYVRRLHDTNQSGLLTLLVFVPFVNLLLFLYLLFAPGTQGSNKYGESINSYNYWIVLGLKKPLNT